MVSNATKISGGYCAYICTADGSNGMVRWYPTGRFVTHRNHDGTSIGCAMAFRRGVAERAGGFDEEMGHGAGSWFGLCEDADFVLRVVESGAAVWYDPSTIMHHREIRLDSGSEAEAKCGDG